MTAEGNTYASGGAKSSVENSDEELIAGVRETLEAHHAYHFRKKGPLPHDDAGCEVDDGIEALDTLARRLKELEDGLKRIAHPVIPPWANFTHDDAARWRQQAFIEFGDIARSLLHAEPQGETQ